MCLATVNIVSPVLNVRLFNSFVVVHLLVTWQTCPLSLDKKGVKSSCELPALNPDWVAFIIDVYWKVEFSFLFLSFLFLFYFLNLYRIALPALNPDWVEGILERVYIVGKICSQVKPVFTTVWFRISCVFKPWLSTGDEQNSGITWGRFLLTTFTA